MAETRQCEWPACLPEEHQKSLADEVLRQMVGESPGLLLPEQWPICGCKGVAPEGAES